MSRTYKTRPILVRAADKNDTHVGVTEVHDHTTGEPCSLPSTPHDQLKLTHEETSTLNCYYMWVYNGHNLCGCPMCTDRWGKETKKQQRRQEDKKSVRYNSNEL